MSVVKAFWIECDNCGDMEPQDMSASTQTQARMVANQRGFEKRRRVPSEPSSVIDVCQTCDRHWEEGR